MTKRCCNSQKRSNRRALRDVEHIVPRFFTRLAKSTRLISSSDVLKISKVSMSCVLLSCVLFLTALSESVRADETASIQAVPINIATGKTYTLVPAPTYKLCTESGDATQLTDGHTMPADESGYFWTKSETVGWVYPKYVYVTIDLGQVEPIGGVAFYTAAGASGVTLPTAAFIQVSDDGETFREIGELLALDRTQNQTVVKNEYALYKISAKLMTKGRYVRLVFLPDASFIFADEVEVYRGDATWLNEPVTAPIALPVEERIAEVRFNHAIRQRYQRDVADIRELVATQILDAVERDTLQTQVAEIEAKLLAEPTPNPKTFRAILPFSENHAELFAVQAEVWRHVMESTSSKNETPESTSSENRATETNSTPKNTNPSETLGTTVATDCLVTWMDDPWKSMKHIGMPEISERFATSPPSMDLMRGEYRGTGWVLYNTTNEPLRVVFTITAPTSPQRPTFLRSTTVAVDAASASKSDVSKSGAVDASAMAKCVQVSLADVPWTDTRTGVPIAAALPDAKRLESADDVNQWQVTVLPGLPKQVWMTLCGIETYNGPMPIHYEISRGENSDIHAVSTDGKNEASMNGDLACQLHVWNLEQPTVKTLYTGGWDYTNGFGSYNVNAKNRVAFLKHLKSHFVNAPWCRPDALMQFSFSDPNDPKSVRIETELMESWLQMWSDSATLYCLFFSISEKFGPYASGTPEFDVALSEWTQQWATWFRSKGIDPQNVSILLQDEPGLNGMDEPLTNFVHWAKVIRAAEPDFRIWEDPVYIPAEKTPTDLLEYSHILCPNRVHWLTNRDSFDPFYTNVQKQGITVHLYSCSGPVKHLDPYAYFRLQAWDCWRVGAKASFFWAMGDDGGVSSWNEYANGKPGYCPSFIDPDSDVIVTAKHFEAMREGTQDYELCHLLRVAADTAKQTAQNENRPAPEAVNVAERLLSDGVRSVVLADGCDQLEWNATVDRTKADLVRRQMLETLDQLQREPRGS